MGWGQIRADSWNRANDSGHHLPARRFSTLGALLIRKSCGYGIAPDDLRLGRHTRARCATTVARRAGSITQAM